MVILPTSTKAFVQSYYGQELIAFCAGQIQLGREELLLGFQDLVITGFAGCVAFRRKLYCRLQRVRLSCSLLTTFLQPFTRAQCVRDVPQRAESGLLVAKQGFVMFGRCLAVLSHQSASFEKRPGCAGCDTPCVGSATR